MLLLDMQNKYYKYSNQKKNKFPKEIMAHCFVKVQTNWFLFLWTVFNCFCVHSTTHLVLPVFKKTWNMSSLTNDSGIWQSVIRSIIPLRFITFIIYIVGTSNISDYAHLVFSDTESIINHLQRYKWFHL